jgi:hypothetical protein
MCRFKHQFHFGDSSEQFFESRGGYLRTVRNAKAAIRGIYCVSDWLAGFKHKEITQSTHQPRRVFLAIHSESRPAVHSADPNIEDFHGISLRFSNLARFNTAPSGFITQLNFDVLSL